MAGSMLRHVVVIVTLALIGTLAWAGSPAVAAQDPGPPIVELSANGIQQLRSFLEENHVGEATQEALLSKLEAGEPWDSISPGASPVSETTFPEGKYEVTRYVYADGSIVVSRAPSFTTRGSEGGGTSPQWVGECTYRGSPPYATYYDNCKAEVDLGIIMMGFHFDYQRVATVGAEITDYRGYYHRIIGGALSNHRFDRFSATQVRYSADLSVPFKGFPVGWTAWMQANVSMTSAWTTNN